MRKSKDRPPIENSLLAAIPARELETLARKLTPVPLDYKTILIDDEDPLDYVYFPSSGIISVLAVYADGNTAELATIGREGNSGFQEMLGARSSDVRLLVQIAGTAMRLRRADFKKALIELPGFQAMMNLHLHTFLHQVMISGACNATHSVSKRLARWLLTMADRTNEDTLNITHDLIAEMLGIYRPTASKALATLQKQGFVSVMRGRIVILNRPALVAYTCECYRLIRMKTERNLPSSK
ncbi:Crp/Fnr family transcriptional regulator [Hyphomicrobium sulfonivorans]|uniref:Crp/Fnr family transcriptional regulator n=1 Tax=Hyphomicrobium sulfonivorans TaxID=121290 RepID=UPI0015706E8A|nr:Crp/Fnr family transcriptional regulator [Hyphomicrobium sulfonivorans]MBI1649069.1 Crp/Fnr family transcriptional regulator [Hyphomicrobium sulfonivorans]NSL70399.1 Crp/Fnr family transcriptional regulator [Hyphomicrobium sulfonivorans]